LAYHVAVRTVGFYRRDYNAAHDQEYYIETLEDDAHLEVNTLTRLDDYRWGTPSIILVGDSPPPPPPGEGGSFFFFS
jgi:hypothetical protein